MRWPSCVTPTPCTQADQAKFGLDKAQDDLSKTTILSPIDGTVTRLQSQLGERVLGTSFNMGTEIMTIADLERDGGARGHRRDGRGADPARPEGAAGSGRVQGPEVHRRGYGNCQLRPRAPRRRAGRQQQSQEATKFEVRIRINEKENFRPGMSVTTEIETRYRTNVLTVPIAA